MVDATKTEGIESLLSSILRSESPVLVVSVPSQEIVAASPGAHRLLGLPVPDLVGHNLSEFTGQRSVQALDLLVDGKIIGYETRWLGEGGDRRRRLWMRAIGNDLPVKLGLVVLPKDDGAEPLVVPAQRDEEIATVVGSTDAWLIVDWISSDVLPMLGRHPEDTVGASLLAMIDPADAAAVMLALAQIARSGEGVTLQVHVTSRDQRQLSCQLILLPLNPAPSCAFAILADDSDGHPADGRAVADTLARLGRGIRGAHTSYLMSSSSSRRSELGLDRLSTRELDVVSRLLAGNRAPAIARELYLTQGTVRNHLSSVFRKLGVQSQQELIELLRADPDISTSSGDRK